MKILVADIYYDEVKAAQMEPEIIERIANSIKDVGLIHEVIVRKTNIELPAIGSPYHLTVGLKRLLACKHLGLTEIEVKVDETSRTEDEIEERSLHENLKRAQLEWWQEAQLVASAHEFYLKRNDKRSKRTRGRPATGESEVRWTMRDTAAALGMALGPTSEAISLAKAVELDPALRNVKDKKTAMKLVRSRVQQINTEEEAGGDDLFVKGVIPRNDLLFGDSAAILKLLPDQCFDACITDPPWLRFQSRTELEKDEQTDKVFGQIFRVLRYNTLLYAVVGFDDYYYYRDYLPKLGFTVAKTPLIWIKKGSMSIHGVTRWEYSRDFELILLAAKGTPSLTHPTTQSGVLEYKIVPPKGMIHPHEKPVPLLQKLIQDSTYEGASVLDPFAGSGAVLEAAQISKRTWLGIERDRERYLEARKRLGLEEK